MQFEYKERIAQLEEEVPVLDPLQGTFECKVDNSEENALRLDRLALRVEKGKVTGFSRFSTLVLQSDDLRPGFNYHTEFELEDVTQVAVAGFVALQVKGSYARSSLPNCDVLITKHGADLRVRSVNCGTLPDTWFFDYTFHQKGDKCTLESSSP